MFASYINKKMTFAKRNVFSTENQELANFARVISHPARVAILDYLAQQNQCISGDISNKIPLSRTTVSQHLQSLKTAGLIHGTVSGNRVYYCLETEKLKRLRQKFGAWLDGLTEKSVPCEIDK